jgi:hypothetical protein
MNGTGFGIEIAGSDLLASLDSAKDIGCSLVVPGLHLGNQVSPMPHHPSPLRNPIDSFSPIDVGFVPIEGGSRVSTSVACAERYVLDHIS